PPLPDRQGGRPPLGSRYSPGPHCLARRGDDDGPAAGDGGRAGAAGPGRGDGGADPGGDPERERGWGGPGPADGAKGLPPQAHDRAAQHRPHPPAATPIVPQAQSIASSSHPRLPDGVTGRSEAGDHAPLDLRPDSQRYHRDETRPRHEPLPVPRRTSDNNPAQATAGGQAPEVAFLGGVSPCVIEAGFYVPLDNPRHTRPLGP